MAGRCRWWRQCRLQAPSKITNRNRNIFYVILFLPLFLLFLLIPGGEIANFKYDGDTSKTPFVTTFFEDSQHGGDGNADDVIREARAVEDPKRIVLWTGFFESRAWRVQGNPFEECAESRCELSVDRRDVKKADAVLFDARGLFRNPQLPEEHPPWQIWILHNSEPPYYIYIDLHRYNNVFNWTSWYRTDADIFAPYGIYMDKEEDHEDEEDEKNDEDKVGDDAKDDGEGDDKGGGAEEKEDDHIASASHPTQQQSSPATDYYHLHDRLVFTATSNCRDRGRRYKKVAQLRKHLPVDAFGDCGIYQCPKRNADCDNLFRQYKFVLAFENGYCRDYVTEKLWDAYHRMQIPIVSGGANYEKFAIPGSYIDYDNFSSVADLAAYVKRVSTDPVLYNSYFKWRERYEALTAPITDWCALCQALHDKGRPPQVYKNLVGWVAQDSCPLYNEYQGFWTQIYLGVFKVFGI